MEKLILHIYNYLINSLYVIFFYLVSLFHLKYRYKTIEKKLYTSIKQDLIIDRDMTETRRQKVFIKYLH